MTELDIKKRVLEFLREDKIQIYFESIPDNKVKDNGEMKEELKKILTKVNVCEETEKWNKIMDTLEGKELDSELIGRLSLYAVRLKMLRRVMRIDSSSVVLPEMKKIPEPPILNPYALKPYIC